MLSERLLTSAVRKNTNHYLKLDPVSEGFLPGPTAGQKYMLYLHIPFCERLCPYCSFNRFPFSEEKARVYFKNLRREMMMLKKQGYTFDSLYIGGGTPTIMIDELCETIDLAKENFSINEVSSETNPNHLIPRYLDKLQGRVQRLSVGVQSFNDTLLKQMDRFDTYGCGEEIFERIVEASAYFASLNVDMIFNFPAQAEEVLISDVRRVIESGATQSTFYPLMASPSVARSLARTVGKVDYKREQRYYTIISDMLTKGDVAAFTHGSAWTFNRRVEALTDNVSHAVRSAMVSNTPSDAGSSSKKHTMIDEYVVDYEEYPAVGSGGITYLGHNLYVNTFSINDYNAAIESGRMSIMGKASFSKRDRMRYRFMMQLFGLRLDKLQFQHDFGCRIEQGLPLEMAFMKAAGAFAHNSETEITLTPKGRYLMVVMMRQFFIGVNNLRDQARSALVGEERELIFGT